MAYFVSGIPTPEEMDASFKVAQKFYTSGAYDQALEAYIGVSEIESPFLTEENVLAEFEDLQVPLQDAAIYKTGSTYFKMLQDENRKAEEAEDDIAKEKAKKMAIEYALKSTEYFDLTQERTKNESLQAQAQNALINTWYGVNDYDRVIQEGEELIEKYPQSQYVLDAMYNIGWAHYDKKEYDKSIEMFNILVTRFPTAGYKSDRALFQIGEAYYDQGKFAEASPFYQRLVNKMRINELTEREIQKIQRDKLAGITNETALDLAAKSQLKVGSCLASIGDFDAAEVAYKRVATLFKFDKGLITDAYQRMADMYYDNGDFESSVQAYRDAIDDVNDKIFRAKMQVLICQRYFDNAYYEDSVREYSYYISSYSDVAFRAGYDLDEAFFWLGRSHYEVGNGLLKSGENEAGNDNIQQALSQYERIFEQFPETDITSRIYFYQAQAYQKINNEENLNNAIAKYNQLLEEFPETPYIEFCYFFIARAYQSLEQYDDAITYYDKINDEFPESLQMDSAMMERAIAYRKKGDEDGAIPSFLAVSRNEPSLFTTARLLLSQYLLAGGRDSEVIDVVSYAVEDTSAIESLYRLSQLYIMLGNAKKNLGNLEESIADYSFAYNLEVPETQEMASVYRACVYIELGQLETAERDLKELMNSDNEDVKQNAQIRLAMISVQQQKREQAVQTYLTLYNSAEDPIDKLGFLRNLTQISAAGKDWERLDKFAHMMLDSEEAEGKQVEAQEFYYKEEAYFNLALAAEEQNDYFKARDYLISGFEKFPKSFFSSDMLIKLGIYYLTIDEIRNEPNSIDIAADYFSRFVKLFPNTSYTEMANYYLGFCYYNGRRFDDAYNAFKSFTTKYPNSEFTPEAVFYYSDCQYNLGNMEDCINGFNVVISKYMGHEKAEEAYYTKAWALMDIARDEEAIETLSTLVEKYPQSQFAPSSIFSIADYLYNEQKYDEAVEMYQKVLDNFPDSEVAIKVPETLTELKETIAYLEYEKAFNLYDQARTSEDLNLYRQAAEMFMDVAQNNPYTEAEIGSYSNGGMCYEAIEEWQNAVDCYDMVIQRFEEGSQVTAEAHSFAMAHKKYIVANKI